MIWNDEVIISMSHIDSTSLFIGYVISEPLCDTYLYDN